MAVSTEDFLQGMRRLGGAVTIVSVADGDTWAGLTATAVTSLSAEPPRLLACINRAGASFETLSRGRKLAVNVLGLEHQSLAMRFAGMDGVAETSRFDMGHWQVGALGVPYLADALVSFECEVSSILDAGSHGIVIGDISAVHTSKNETQRPLFYMDGKWASLSGA